jgi:hypothetical protein
MKNYRVPAIACMILLAALSRLLPHPPNFAPITAVALFGAATLSPWWLAFVVPLGAMLLSDAALEWTTKWGLFDGWLSHGYGFHRGMVAIYAIFLLITALGLLLRRRRGVLAIGSAALAASVLFFLLSNFAVWAGGEVGYPRTLQGLEACYVAGLPFFQWTLLGDACYVLLLFGGLALVEYFVPSLVLRPEGSPTSTVPAPTVA